MKDAINNPNVDLVVSKDGSHTLKLKGVDEHYHSTHGAIEESEYVYIQSGLQLFKEKQEVSILEVGFGTGANALLSERWGKENKVEIEYSGLELFPLPAELLNELNYPEMLGGEALNVFKAIHAAPWGQMIAITSHFSLMKLEMDVLDLDRIDAFDLVFFDAFGPQTQPELWTTDVFQKVFNACKRGAVLVTYCAKGQVRRDLQSVGFSLERLPGPPAKRHILRAQKL